MKKQIIIQVPIEREITCLWCDHGQHLTKKVKKTRLEWIKGWDIDFSREKEVSIGYNCSLLKAYIRYPESEDPKDSPCGFKKWFQTNDSYELEYESFTLILKDGNLVQLSKTEEVDKQ